MEDELAPWFAPDEVAAAADRFRELYVEHGVSGTSLMPGALEAVNAVRDLAGRAIVVTAKFEPNAVACLAHVGLSVDAVIGWRHGPAAKGQTLLEHGATVFVGDTPYDIEGAHAANAVAVAVCSGPHNAGDVRAAGADVVLDSLVEFPAWLETYSRRE